MNSTYIALCTLLLSLYIKHQTLIRSPNPFFKTAHFRFNTLTLSRKSSSPSHWPVLSILNIKWSRTRPSFTLSLNSSCRRHSRLTVSRIGSWTTARMLLSLSRPGAMAAAGLVVFSSASSISKGSSLMTPFGKQRANLRASAPVIGLRI